jgi:hypothetical protein
MSFLSQAIVHRVNQEPGAMPGAGLKPLTAIAYFVGAPIALFVIIGAFTLLATSRKK